MYTIMSVTIKKKVLGIRNVGLLVAYKREKVRLKLEESGHYAKMNPIAVIDSPGNHLKCQISRTNHSSAQVVTKGECQVPCISVQCLLDPRNFTVISIAKPA